ncbi:SAM-dependent methyltransferase [Streptomyces winkii]|uniref:SAM-dependent methyltransferase n=1 Tax=Streptomyces winkii TaxID=3051178 RepID=UPI0028D3F444|nr:SAM-dependent methyltransferase [Streptomyces sp. DSM 40971]
MLTLTELVNGTHRRAPVLQWVARPRHLRDSVVKEIVVWERATASRPSATAALVIVDGAQGAGDLRQLTVQLERAGAVGAVLLDDVDVPDSPRLPVFRPTTACTALEIQSELLRRKAEASDQWAHLLQQLLDRSGRFFREGKGPEALVKWLSQTTGAHLAVLDPVEGAERVEGVDPGLLDVFWRIRNGSPTWGADDGPDGQGPYVLMHALERIDPVALAGNDKRPVLVSTRNAPWHPLHKKLMERAAAEVNRLQLPVTWRTEHAELHRSWSAVRQSGLQLLMTGNVAVAGRVLAPLMPDLLTREWMRMGILQCAPGQDREQVRGECERIMAGDALVVLCLGEPRNVLVLTPDEGTGDGRRLRDALRPVLEERGLVLGVSASAAWRHTTLAYRNGMQALTRARQEPGRVAFGDSKDTSGSLVKRLKPWTQAWAASVLHAPLSRLPVEERRELVHVATMALSLGPVQAAHLLGTVEDAAAARGGWVRRVSVGDRNQVTEKLQRLGRDAGLTGSRMERAVLYLALGLDGVAGPDGAVPAESAPPTLRQVLDSPEAVSWQRELLGGLTGEQRALLVSWLVHGTEATAEAERTSQRTVRNRLAKIGNALGRTLTGKPAHTYEVILALAIAGELTLPDPGPQTSPVTAAPPKPSGSDTWSPAPRVRRPAPRWSGLINACRDGDYWYPHEGELLRRVDDQFPFGRLVRSARNHRERVVRWAAGQGVRQFLHLGCGLPQAPHLHEWAPPGARWVNADQDPVARVYFGELAPSVTAHRVGCTALTPGDPEGLLETLSRDHGMDLSRPLGVIYGETGPVLDPLLVSRTVSRLAPGSLVSVCELAEDDAPGFAAGMKILREAGLICEPRTEEETAALVEGLVLVEPGVVRDDAWHPELAPPDRPVEPVPGSAGWHVAVARVGP